MLRKIKWLWKRFWGTKIIIKFIETGLQEDEVLFYGHKVYIPENTVLKIERSKDGQQTTFRNERRNR